MLPILSIGPLSLPTPGLILLIGLWLGTTLAERFSPRRAIDSNKLYNLVMAMLISGFVGARLGFILQHLASYLANPLDMLALNMTANDPWSGGAAAFLAGAIYSRHHNLRLLDILDALTPLAAVQMIFIHLANLASGAAFGSETSLPWGIFLWGAIRHPVQIYEATFAVLILIWLWNGFFTKENGQPGNMFLVFVGLSAGERLLLEAFHGDSYLIGSLRAVQLTAWVVLAAALYARARLPRSSPAA
jgi:phosphatidylglycerol:prolipoprotein diacylglycerol transferase